MEYCQIDGISFPVSRCVLGTSGIRDSSKYELLDEFYGHGGNCLDTARVYGGGVSEEAVGGWLRAARPERVMILAKGAHTPNCTPAAIGAELSQTLEALGVPTVDLYMLHRDDPTVPVGEFMDALEAERAGGRLSAYGVSNWAQERVVEANAYALSRGIPRLVAISNHFSLAEPVEPLYPGCHNTSAEYRTFLTETGTALFPWSSQARGFFSDNDHDTLDPNMWRCWNSESNFQRRARCDTLARTLGCRSINIALAYVLAQPFPVFPIIGPQTVAELIIALDGMKIELDSGLLHWLEFGGNGRFRERSGSAS